MTAEELARIEAEIVGCRACPRLVEWREEVARVKVARFADQTYWGRPVPGFGDPSARVMVLGLAPAAHGGTGPAGYSPATAPATSCSRRSTGPASRTSRRPSPGRRAAVDGTFIAAVNRCAPPANKPTPLERDTCLPYLEREIEALGDLRVIVALGSFAWDGALQGLRALGHTARPKPRFGHGAESAVGPFTLIGCFHPASRTRSPAS
jgi:uracil-DNA glycosylase